MLLLSNNSQDSEVLTVMVFVAWQQWKQIWTMVLKKNKTTENV